MTESPDTIQDVTTPGRAVANMRLLVVDDEVDVCRLVSAFFEDTEWEVVAVGSLIEAVRSLADTVFPVILCDVHMPGGGTNLVKAAKLQHASTQVIMFTGDPTIDTAREALRQGAYDYVVKPCQREDLIRIVQRAYERFALIEDRDRLEQENRNYARHLEELVERRTSQLKESELKYRAVFDRAVDAILLVDATTGRITGWNIATTRLLNTSGPELYDRPIRDFVGDRFDEMLSQAYEPKHAEWRFEQVRFAGEHGWERMAQVAAGKVEFADKAHLQIVARDVTDQVELRERHERMELELLNEQRLAAIGLLVSGVAHNINTPLTGIYGTAQLIKLKYPEIDDIDGVIAQVERINGIIRNLMWKSRQEQDQSVQEIDINQLLAEELRFLEADLDFKHNVDRTFEFADDVPTIMGRYSDFSMSVMNVVRNALDATHGQKERSLFVGTSVRDSDLCITVKDNGCGISPEDRARIFLPFYTTKALVGQGDSSHPTGTGLGLATVQKLLGPYGARYDIESAPNAGTTFVIRIPLSQNAASARRQNSSQNT